MRPASLYMTLTLRGLGFTTFQANLLTIPEKVGHSECFLLVRPRRQLTQPVIMMLGITYLGEALKELSLVSMISQIWALPFLIFLNVVDVQGLNRWVLYGVVTLLLIYPNRMFFFSFREELQTDKVPSTSDPGGLELAQLQCRAVAHRVGGVLQHVCAGKRYHRIERVSGRYVGLSFGGASCGTRVA